MPQNYVFLGGRSLQYYLAQFAHTNLSVYFTLAKCMSIMFNSEDHALTLMHSILKLHSRDVSGTAHRVQTSVNLMSISSSLNLRNWFRHRYDIPRRQKLGVVMTRGGGASGYPLGPVNTPRSQGSGAQSDKGSEISRMSDNPNSSAVRGMCRLSSSTSRI